MKYFQNPADNGIWAYEADGSQDQLIPGEFVPLTQQQAETALADPAPALADLTPRQIRMALTRVGLRAQVESAVAAGDQDLKDWWEQSLSFERGHVRVEAMRVALGQTPQMLDFLWALGETL